MKRLLLISGSMGAGKTTVARHVRKYAQEDGYMPASLKFADPLYEIHDAAMEILQRYGHNVKGVDRTFLQILGTNWGRRCLGENFWVDLVTPRIRALLSHPKSIVVIDDVRFPNELAIASQFPSLTVRLEASEEARRNRAEKWGSTVHESELSLDASSGFDVVFDTTSSYLEDLGRQLWKKMKENS